MLISDLPKVMLISLTITLVVEVSIAFILKYRKKDLVNVLLVINASLIFVTPSAPILLSVHYFIFTIYFIFIIIFLLL